MYKFLPHGFLVGVYWVVFNCIANHIVCFLLSFIPKVNRFTMESGDLKINIERLVGAENWRNWKMEIEDALVIKGVFDAVSVEQQEPELPDEEATAAIRDKYQSELKKYRLNIAYARSIIRSSLSSEIKLKVAACETPFQIWNKLCDIFEQKSTSRLRRLLTQVLRAKMEHGMDMSTHLAKMRTNWADLQQAAQQEEKVSIPDCIYIECVFESLPQEKYMEFNSLWDTMAKSKRTVDKLEQLLLERASRMANAAVDESAGMMAKSTGGGGRGKFNGARSNPDWKSGGASGKSQGQGKVSNFKFECYLCHEKGHIKRDCPKRNKSGGATGGANDKAGSLVCVESGLVTKECDQSWYSDTGASQHITNDASKFVSFEMFDKPRYMRVGSGELMQVNGQGVLLVEIELNGHWVKTKLSDVWFIPGFSNNLFSVQSTLKRNPTWEYKASIKHCFLFDGKPECVKLHSNLG